MSTNNPPSLHPFDEPKLEAFVELMVLAAAADGEFSEQERRHFLSSVESLTDRRLSGGLDPLVSRIEADLRKSGREARLAAVRERLSTPALRKAAFSMAVQVTAADGIIRTSEREWLMELADALEIDHDQAADLVAQIAP